MRIAIIGTGNLGSAIAHGFRASGHDLVLGTRLPKDARIAGLSATVGATADLPVRAAAAAEVIVLALPWAAASSAIGELGDLTGKIVIDCMNPLGTAGGSFGLVLGHTDSGGETVQRWLPRAHVVKTLNQVGAEIIADTSALPHRPVQFLAGNDTGAKAQVADLLAELGFEALDAGDISKARLLEPLAMVWINQALFRNKGRNWAMAAVHSDKSGEATS